jgi:hypothetical protein
MLGVLNRKRTKSNQPLVLKAVHEPFYRWSGNLHDSNSSILLSIHPEQAEFISLILSNIGRVATFISAFHHYGGGSMEPT